MPLPKDQTYTIEDIYALPDGQRAELIDGQLYMMAPPNRRHQKISFALSRTIADFIDKHNGSCEVYPAPFAVFLNADDKPTLNLISASSATGTSLTTGAAKALPTGLLKLYHPPAEGWTIDTSIICMQMQVFGNTGSSIQKRSVSPSTTTKRMTLRPYSCSPSRSPSPSSKDSRSRL